MKNNKRLIMMLAVMVLASLVFAQKGWVSLDGGMYDSEPQLTVLESGLSGVTFNFKISGMWVENVMENQTEYQRINLPGAWPAGEIGKPMLPVICKKVAIPANSGVKVEIVDKKEMTITGYNVYPAQEPSPECDPKPPFTIDKEFYSSNTTYPSRILSVGEPGIMGQVRLVGLEIEPFRYNPATKELTVITELTVRVEYEGYDSRNALLRTPSGFLPEFERLYRAELLNFDGVYGGMHTMISTSSARLPGLLVIYAHNYSNSTELEWFIEWKRGKGFHVDAVDQDDIPGINGAPNDAADVRNYIKNWAEATSLYDPCWVLLIGDAPTYVSSYDDVKCADDNHIPTFATYEHPDTDYGNIFSDYEYQLFEGDDDYADICLGRWCPEDANDLYTYIDKIWWYEFDPSSSSTWNPDKILMVAHKGIYDWDFEGCKERIISWYLSGYTVAEVYGSDPAVRNQDVIDALEYAPGVGVVNYRGHGGVERWYDWNQAIFSWNRDFTTSDINDLGHYYRFPVVYNIACYNGQVTSEDESVVEAWTRNAYGGAVGAFGSSMPSYTMSNDMLDERIFDGHYTWDLGCGAAIKYALDYLICIGDTYPYYDTINLANARMYYWIGDPTIDVWRGDPVAAYIEGPSSIPAFPSGYGASYLVTVKRTSDDAPIAGAMVCMYKEGEYHQAGYTDIGGQVYFDVEGPLSVGSMTVTATCQKKPIAIHPAFASIPVVTLQPSSGDVEEPPAGLLTWQLESVHPNPFRNSVTISYSVAGQEGSADSRFVDIRVFDMSGRQVKSLASGRTSPGHYEVMWDGRDDKGMECSAGIYFVRMRSVDYQSSERIVLVK